MITVDFNRLCRSDPHRLDGCRILDVGCGTGRHTCAAYALDTATVIGVDISAKDVAEAAQRLALHDRLGQHGGGTWGLGVASIHNLPFKDGFFDLVICSEVLEHIVDQQGAVHELMRVTTPGGDLAVSVPRYGPERVCWALSRDYRNTPGGHVRIYKKQELIDLFKTAGATATQTHYAHSLHTPYWWLKCLVGVNRDDIPPVGIYHRFLVWDMMKKPRLTRCLERLFNPVLGKSTVIYFKKKQ